MEIEQMENVMKQMTSQLKTVKQESHLNVLELQKALNKCDELELENDKLMKQNQFL